MRHVRRIAAPFAVCLLFALPCARGGAILREVYTGISGTSVADLTNSAKYLAGAPDSTNWIYDLFEVPINVAENYGQRVHGYVVPPQSGYYTFWISGDDNCELSLGTNAYPLTNLTRIAYHTGWTWAREWNKYGTQPSSPIYLEAGKMYAISALMKEGTGGDHLAVRWQLPNGNMEEPIPCTRLLPPGGPFQPPTLAAQSETSVVKSEGDLVEFWVAVSNMYPVSYQWRRDGAGITNATASNCLIAALAPADTGAEFDCILSNSLGVVTSATVTLTVLADTNPPTLSAVYNVGTTAIHVVFSETVHSNSATLAANYRLSGPAVNGALLDPALRRVVLTVSPLVYGSNYTLTVSNVYDRASVSNRIADETAWAFTAREFASQEIGGPALTGSVSYAGAEIDLTAAGTGLGGMDDQFRFNWKLQTGDFDVRVRVESLDLSDIWAQAGIMARAGLQDDSDFCAALAAPSIAGVRFAYRRTLGGNLLLNPDFELGKQYGQQWPTNWGGWGAAVAETNNTPHAGGKRAPAGANDGTWMLYTPNVWTDPGDNWQGEGQWFAVTPGETYVFSAHLLIQSNLPPGQCTYIDLEWFDAAKGWPDIAPRYYSDYFSNQCAWTYVAVTGVAPAGSVWAKAVIAFQDKDGRTNSPGEQYNTYWDTASVRIGAGGAVECTGFFPVNYPNTWLRLKRVGDAFTAYASFDGTAWSPLGTVSNPLPATVYLGMAAMSHDEDETTTASFWDWGSVSGGTTGTARYVQGEPPGPSSRATGLIISEIMYHPPSRADGKDIEFIELFNTDPSERDLTDYRISGDADYAFPSDTVIPAGGFLVIARTPADVESVYGLSGVLGPYSGSLPNDSGTVRIRHPRDAVLWEVEYSDDAPWPVAADGAGHSLVLARPSYGEEDSRAWAASAKYGGSPGALEAVWSNAYGNVVINEFLAHTDPPLGDFIEIYNRGTQAVDLAGCFLSDNLDTNKFAIPGGTTLAGRNFLSFDTNAMGFNLSSMGETILLRAPDQSVIDIVRFGAQENAQSSGRYPDGSPGFHELSSPTEGTNNTPLRIRDIVINEIMYHPISGDDDDQYVELRNIGSSNVNLKHWRFVDGITFTFTDDAILPAGGCVVVARDAARLIANYPALAASNTFGDFSGSLARSGERVALAKPDDLACPDENFVVVDEVIYNDGWGAWSDGGGSSLELRDARSDNRLAANWADSDETAKAPWTYFSVTGHLDNGTGPIDEIHLLLLDAGECLVDDIDVRRQGGGNRCTNGNFNSGAAGWTIQGNHIQSTATTNLHLRATGGGDTSANRIETDLNSDLWEGTNAIISGKARWLCGHPDLLFRLRGNWMEAVCSLDIPADLGTPGAANSRVTNNAPPAVWDVTHAPILPAADEPVVVSARVHDPDNVGNVLLKYRLDPDTTTNSITMLDNGTGGDACAGDGQYSATLSGQAADTLIAFWIQAADSNAPPATALYPADTPARECLVRWGDARPWGALGSYRLWMTQKNIAAWTNRPPLSNEALDGTFVSGDSRVIYNIGTRYRGSPFLRVGFDSPMGSLCAYIVEFPKGDRFLSETKVNLDTLEPGRDNTLQRERTMFWMAEQIGLPVTCQRYVHMFFNGEERGEAYSDSLHVDRDYVQCWFPDDDDGDLFKIDDWHEFTNDSSFVVNWPEGMRNATLEEFTTTGGILKQARYRWNWEKKSMGGVNDDYQRLFDLVDVMNETNEADYVQRVQTVVAADEWMDIIALRHVTTDWDGYGYSRGKNMYAYKAPGLPWHLLLWDLDFGLGADNQATDTPMFYEINDPVLSNRFFATPVFRRAFWQATKRLCEGPMLFSRVEPFMDGWYEALSSHGVSVFGPSSAKQWIALRRNYCLTQVDTVEAPFDVFGSGGDTNQNMVTLSGAAPLDVVWIAVNGVAHLPSWTSVSNWSIIVTLDAGSNPLSIEGLDRDGNPVHGATDTINFNYTGGTAAPADCLVINEILYHPTNDSAEFVEIHNLSTNVAFDLFGYRVQGIDFVFPESAVIGPTGFLVVAENASVFAQTYGDLIPVAAACEPGSLDNGGEWLRLFDPATALVDEVFFDDVPPWPTNADGVGPSLQLMDAQEDNNRVGNWAAGTGVPYTPGAANSVACDLPPFPLLWINELQVTNVSGIRDNANDREPWVELFNAETANRSLTNFYLTDTYTNLTRWVFPAGAWAPSNGFRVVWLDNETGETSGTNYHASFRPGTASGCVALVYSNAGRTILIDYMDYAVIPADRSCGSFPDGAWTNRMLFLYPTPGGTNNAAGSPITVRINEWMADNDNVIADPYGDYDDWVELYNFGTNAVDLTDYTLTDNLNSPAKWTFPTGTLIQADGFLLIWADSEPEETNGLHTSWGLSKGGEAIGLFTAEGVVVDSLVFGAQETDVSEGRWPDAGPNMYTMAIPTPLAPNIVSTNNTMPTLDPIGEKNVNEQALLQFTATAGDSDTPAQTLTFSLGPDAPAAAAIDPSTGVFTWTPGEADGPDTVWATIRVTDNGSPAKTNSETIQINVAEVNQAPTLLPLGNVTLGPGSLLTIQATATDADIPANALSFSLLPPVPDGAAIVAGTGVFSWTPDDTHASSTSTVSILVQDDGVPVLSDTGSFLVVISGMDQIFETDVQSIPGSGNFVVRWSSESGLTYRVEYVPSLLWPPWNVLVGDVVATSDVAEKVDTTTNATSQRFYRVLRLLP
ncbi:MAG: lamin tail domain-containing protein [Kiritimatiellae bacterium]|nr:lamin tail domain-containing protein [Kiritimatiellia bacterium]